jgi:hypothetical protein
LLSAHPATHAALARFGQQAPARLAARAACHVRVAAPEPWHAAVTELLGHAGLGHCDDAGQPTVTLLVTVDEPPRSHVDRLVRDDRTHLLVSLLADRVRLGPFVAPGVTACLRCVDAHLGELDPRRALVLQQLEDTPPADVSPDLALVHAALALAAREVTTYADGDHPATWSATLTLDPDLHLPRRAWTRHPHCGCSWG